MGTFPDSPTAASSAVGQKRWHPHHIQLGRRGMLLGTGAAIAAAALAAPGIVSADDDHDEDQSRRQPQAVPKPIPGLLAPKPFDFHVFGPGPATITLPLSEGQLQGLDVEPSVITNYRGFTALAYPVGTARGSDGKLYDHEGDIRLFSGTYQPADGSSARHGSFALIWIDLFEPGTGSPHHQLHDVNGGVLPSGLFWLVELNAKDVEISHDGTRASMRASNVPLVDSFVFGGQNQIGAIASFSFRWHATGPFVKQGKGADPKPPPATDPAAFTGRFARASAEGTFSVRELGFSFTSIGTVKSDPQGYAEMGFESNGNLLVPNP